MPKKIKNFKKKPNITKKSKLQKKLKNLGEFNSCYKSYKYVELDSYDSFLNDFR